MVLATVGLIVPALFHNLVPEGRGLEHRVSVAVCVMLVQPLDRRLRVETRDLAQQGIGIGRHGVGTALRRSDGRA